MHTLPEWDGLEARAPDRHGVAREPAEPRDRAPDFEPGRPPRDAARRLSVLVADGHADAAESLALLLWVGGHAPRVACGGDEAVRAAELDPPDVVLIDLRLPDRDGCEVVRQLRGRPWPKRPLLVALTGGGREDERRRALEAGIDVYLLKPVDPAALLRLLARFARVVLPPAADQPR